MYFTTRGSEMIDLESMDRVSLSDKEYWNYLKRSPLLLGVICALGVILAYFGAEKNSEIQLTLIALLIIPFWLLQRNQNVVFLDERYLYIVKRGGVSKVERRTIREVRFTRDRSYARFTVSHVQGATMESLSFVARHSPGTSEEKRLASWKALKEELVSGGRAEGDAR